MCNFSKTVHKKWLQALEKKMIDVYHATIDNLTRVALQSLFYFNYLRGGPRGIEPSQSELQLHLVSRSRKSELVVKLLEKVAIGARSNSMIPHLEGETIFGNAKRKLDLHPGDIRHSHHHDRVNFSIPMVGIYLQL